MSTELYEDPESADPWPDFEQVIAPETAAGYLSKSLQKLLPAWKAFDKTSIRIERNLSAVFSLSMGTVNELYAVLGRMCGFANVKEKEKVWTKMKELTSLFRDIGSQGMLAKYRNRVCFHLDEQVIRAGLNEVKDEEVTFLKFESGQVRDIYYSDADEIQYRGFCTKEQGDVISSPTEQAYRIEMEEFIGFASELHSLLPQRVEELFNCVIESFDLQLSEGDLADGSSISTE